MRDKKLTRIIDICDALRRKDKHSSTEDIDGLVLDALVFVKKKTLRFSGNMTIVNEEEVRYFFQSTMIDILRDRNMMNPTLFLCACYTAELLTRLFYRQFRHVNVFGFLVENAKTGNPFLLQEGADACLLFSSLFPKKGNAQAINARFYKEMGVRLYGSFYRQTEREIGRHMSEHFLVMSDVAAQCMRTLRVYRKY